MPGKIADGSVFARFEVEGHPAPLSRAQAALGLPDRRVGIEDHEQEIVFLETPVREYERHTTGGHDGVHEDVVFVEVDLYEHFFGVWRRFGCGGLAPAGRCSALSAGRGKAHARRQHGYESGMSASIGNGGLGYH